VNPGDSDLFCPDDANRLTLVLLICFALMMPICDPGDTDLVARVMPIC
jgi:hypothetical protein